MLVPLPWHEQPPVKQFPAGEVGAQKVHDGSAGTSNALSAVDIDSNRLLSFPRRTPMSRNLIVTVVDRWHTRSQTIAMRAKLLRRRSRFQLHVTPLFPSVLVEDATGEESFKRSGFKAAMRCSEVLELLWW